MRESKLIKEGSFWKKSLKMSLILALFYGAIYLSTGEMPKNLSELVLAEKVREELKEGQPLLITENRIYDLFLVPLFLLLLTRVRDVIRKPNKKTDVFFRECLVFSNREICRASLINNLKVGVFFGLILGILLGLQANILTIALATGTLLFFSLLFGLLNGLVYGSGGVKDGSGKSFGLGHGLGVLAGSIKGIILASGLLAGFINGIIIGLIIIILSLLMIFIAISPMLVLDRENTKRKIFLLVKK
jgi:hypothetical protein